MFRIHLYLTIVIACLLLWQLPSHAQSCQQWPDGVDAIFCGRGGSPCPDGFTCHIHPADFWAVCRPDTASNYCPAPPNLTGMWEGRIVCTSISQGAKQRSTDNSSTVRITHIPNSPIRAEVNGFPYSGIAAALEKSPEKGAITLGHCGTDPASKVSFDEVLSGTFNVTARNARIRGKSTWRRGNALTGDALAATGGNCRFTYKRVSSEDPGLPACP